MDIYIVLYDTREHGFSETKHSSYADLSSAKMAAVSSANNTRGDSLNSILKLNTTSKEVTSYELVLEKGRFDLKKNNPGSEIDGKKSKNPFEKRKEDK